MAYRACLRYDNTEMYNFLCCLKNDIVKDLLKSKDINEKLNSEALDDLKTKGDDLANLFSESFENFKNKEDSRFRDIQEIIEIAEVTEVLTAEQISEIETMRNNGGKTAEKNERTVTGGIQSIENKNVTDSRIENGYDIFIKQLLEDIGFPMIMAYLISRLDDKLIRYYMGYKICLRLDEAERLEFFTFCDTDFLDELLRNKEIIKTLTKLQVDEIRDLNRVRKEMHTEITPELEEAALVFQGQIKKVGCIWKWTEEQIRRIDETRIKEDKLSEYYYDVENNSDKNDDSEYSEEVLDFEIFSDEDDDTEYSEEEKLNLLFDNQEKYTPEDIKNEITRLSGSYMVEGYRTFKNLFSEEEKQEIEEEILEFIEDNNNIIESEKIKEIILSLSDNGIERGYERFGKYLDEKDREEVQKRIEEIKKEIKKEIEGKKGKIKGLIQIFKKFGQRTK